MGIKRHAPASTRKHAGTGSKRHLCSPPAARACRNLYLGSNKLAALPEGIFAPLSQLRQVPRPPIVSVYVCGIDTRVPIWWTYMPVSAVPQARVRTRGRSSLVDVAPKYMNVFHSNVICIDLHIYIYMHACRCVCRHTQISIYIFTRRYTCKFV